MAYNFRERSPKNYKELAAVALLRAQRTKAADPVALYRVEILERDNKRVKVHCYVNLNTVSYYLRKRRNLVEYSTGGCKLEHKGGFVLVFKFVRMDGVSRHLPAVPNAE